MTLLTVVVGFLGPFGTYIGTSLVERVGEWGQLLLGAYVLVRPWIWALQRIARGTSLPADPLALWGVAAFSLPMAMVWRSVGQDAYRALDGYAELLPFALLCALAVLAAVRWAQAASDRLVNRAPAHSGPAAPETDAPPPSDHGDPARSMPPTAAIAGPPLLSRLSPAFDTPIVALQSEDHYVRVHGRTGSELLLMRLRDAIGEMAGSPGEQVHRSWWVARCGVAGTSRAGRTWHIRLLNGQLAPVARESIHRLRTSGFLTDPGTDDAVPSA